MTKIGRNELCPCGSGKKYKKCCIDKSIAENFPVGVNSKVPWGMDTVKQLSTESIFEELKNIGIEITEKKFLTDVKKYYSAMDLAEDWMEVYPLRAGVDEDFIWMAITVLWQRLAPEHISTEQLDIMMQRGYALEDAKGMCDIWLQ